MLEILPAVKADDDPWGEDRPIRPDLPMLRWFSYTKWHALQLGFFVALLLYWTSVTLGQDMITAGIALYFVRYVLGFKEVSCNHTIGIHDIREKPWYFVTSLIVSTAALRTLLPILL